MAAAPAAPPEQPRAPEALAFRIVEHQRHFPFLVGWRHPVGLYDPHAYEDEAGHPANAPSQAGWEVEVTERTDRDGWLYGTAFERIATLRKGGRAGKRATDACRLRKWRYGLEGAPAALVAAGDGRGEDGDAVGLFLFWQVLRSTLGRRPIREVPMDPTSLYRVRSAHARWYREWVTSRLPAGPAPRRDVVDLAHAAIYIRATYGFAMAEGHMDGVRRGAAMFTYRKAIFDVAEDVDDAENTACLLRLAGLEAADLLHVAWSNRTYRPSHFVAVDHARRWVVVAIRGTLATRDVLTDVTASQVAFCGGHAHLGFIKSAAFVEREAAPALAQAKLNHPDYALVLCGHSMAGSIGAVLALAARHGKTAWPTFGGGPPRVFSIGGGGALSDALAEESKAFAVFGVHGKDPVPRLSVLRVEALLDELVDEGLGRKLNTLLFGATAPEPRSRRASVRHKEGDEGDDYDDAAAAASEAAAAPDAAPPAKSDSALSLLEVEPEPDDDADDDAPSSDAAAAIDAALAEDESRIRVPLYTPGRCIHVDWDSFDGTAGAITPFCFATVPTDYDRLLLSYTLLGYHIPKGYCELLFELAGAYDDSPPHPEDADDADLAAAATALRDRLRRTDWARPEVKGKLF